MFKMSKDVLLMKIMKNVLPQNGVTEKENRALKEMVNSMLSYSGLNLRDAIFYRNRFSSIHRPKNVIPNLVESQGDDHPDDVPSEIPKPRKVACITTIRLLLALAAIRNLVVHQMDVKTTLLNSDLDEEVYMKQPEGFAMPGCRAVVRLPDPKRKILGEKGIDCIFVGYAENSKTDRFFVIEPNDSVSVNSIIDLRDAIFYGNRFSSIHSPKNVIPNLVESQGDDHPDDVPSEIPKPHKGKGVRKAKTYGSDFQLYLVEGSRDHVRSQYLYCYSIEKDPRTYNETMQSRDAAF
nr:zinc finger, CCHC-type [Tanacetum cinerariifolium]